MRKIKLEYAEWNESDKAPAKVRFVKNEVELSEKKILHILDGRVGKVKKEMTILTAISTVILAGECIIFFGLLPHLKRLNMFLLNGRKDIEW